MKSRYCSACFDGFGLKSLDKTQVMLFYVRRLALTATGKSQHSLKIVFLFPELNLFLTTLVFASIQLAYMVAHFAIRPMNFVKDQLQEMLNELIYFVLIVVLFFWKEEEDWSSFKTNMYIWVMVGNTVIFLLISLSE